MDFNIIPMMDMHNHTIWSDGIHKAETIIENAIKHEISAIGISDHFNTKKCKSLSTTDVKDYIQSLKLLKEKYKDEIEVYSGLELCMNRNLSDVDNLPFEELNNLDYVLFEYIDTFKESVTLSQLKDYSKKLTCKKGLAHLNLLDCCSNYGLNFVITTLKENNLFWELNVNQGYEYFNQLIDSIDSWKTKRLLRKLKKYQIPMSVGSDTHCLDYYDIERLFVGNLLCKHKSINILKYDMSVNRLLHSNKSLSHNY